MIGGYLRATLLASVLAFALVRTASAQSAGEAPPGLPPVIESTGPGPTAPAIDNVTAPYLQKPVRSPEQSRPGSVLDTLDNLPPVGTPAQSSGLPALPDDFPDEPAQPVTAPPEPAQPRVVRFGDVRTESAARQQFPELRNRASSSPANRSGAGSSAAREEETPAGARGFLTRLMPWRRRPASQAEPPLVLSSRADDDRPERIARSVDVVDDRPALSGESAGALPGTRNRAVADRIDQELRIKADRLARQAVGTRTSELDVQVIDEEIYIRARPMWFWQRRQVTDQLRNLPGFEPRRVHVTVY